MLLVTLFLKIYLVIEIFAFLKSILSIHCYLLHSVYTRILPVTSWTRTQGSWQSTFLTQGDNTVTLPPPWTVTTPALVSWGTKFPPQNPSIPSSSTHWPPPSPNIITNARNRIILTNFEVNWSENVYIAVLSSESQNRNVKSNIFTPYIYQNPWDS